ncbi:ABC TRANSPORTER A FAMILY PROTEIN [Salix purpurea]|uniref:ABC TRANSPORTER A FAMILY PROTEIN n=1 Tax=Salix purpurea TaxID=77065 RepID=A0A9Q0W4U2_SALPP|nr:ABC TRANSPORTER A FAMILY PROTEIN [Salix purpurea]
MGYVLRVRLASFFAGAATSSFAGLYILYKDFKVAHDAIFQQVESVHESLDRRISALEKLKQNEATQPLQAAEIIMTPNYLYGDDIQAAFKGGGSFLKPRPNRKTPLPYTSTFSVNRIEYTFSEILDREIEIQA